MLYWHQWKLRGDDGPAPARPAGTLDRIGLALAEGARNTLRRPTPAKGAGG
jgi:hypothetical protein